MFEEARDRAALKPARGSLGAELCQKRTAAIALNAADIKRTLCGRAFVRVLLRLSRPLERS